MGGAGVARRQFQHNSAEFALQSNLQLLNSLASG